MSEKKIGTLIKAYQSKRKIREGQDYDSLLLIYRDEKGDKKTIFIDRAEVPFYVIKDKSSPEAVSPPMFIEKDKIERISTFSDLMFREIAAKTDSLYYFDRVITTWGSYSSNMKNLFKHNWLYDSDMDFVDRYMAKFHEDYEPDINYKLHKCYFDIEVDLMPNGWKKDAKGNLGFMGFPDEELAPCPVNVVTLFDEKAMEIHTFVVRNDLNESIKKLEANSTEFKKKISEKLNIEDEVEVTSVNLEFFNSEEECIEAFFNKIHTIDPDFALAWNQAFDLLTLQNRLKKIYSRKIELKEQGIKGYDQMLTAMSDSKYRIQKDRFGNVAYLSPKAYYVAHKDKPFVDRTDSFEVMDGINWMD
jgi:DNA polymerase elongation subunit (family B)